MVDLDPKRVQITRRQLLAGVSGAAFALAPAGPIPGLTVRGVDAAEMLDELTIDLASEPANLDPATTYEADGWSIVHSIYDAPVQYAPDGTLENLLAGSIEQPDPLTLAITLRAGRTFHNGEALTADALAYSISAIQQNKASQIAGNFATIASVTVDDPLTARLTLSAPSPWLPAQMAAWLAVLPPVYASANDFAQKPVGTGPYRFVEWIAGERIVLEINPDYPADSPKGVPIAKRVVYRFVGDPSTRVADLRAGTAGLIRAVPVDQEQTVNSGDTKVIVTPLSGVTFVRISTGIKPFDDVRVRQALNYAVDVDGIVGALLGGHGQRLASVFPAGGLGYDPALAPYTYDPDKAKALLKEAGFESGFKTSIAVASTERIDLVEAIAAQLGDAGIEAKVNAVEVATFNQTWTDPQADPLRFVSWRPMFDPYTLLSLIFAKGGFLSVYDNPDAQTLIEAAAVETDPATRAAQYRQLGTVLHNTPGAIYLWSLTALYGASTSVTDWTPRPDDYIIPTSRG